MENGVIDAELGGGGVKKRVPLPGRGKSGGARTLLATNKSSLWFFVFGFEKNKRQHQPQRAGGIEGTRRRPPEALLGRARQPGRQRSLKGDLP
jgi:hypothetical protein